MILAKSRLKLRDSEREGHPGSNLFAHAGRLLELNRCNLMVIGTL